MNSLTLESVSTIANNPTQAFGSHYRFAEIESQLRLSSSVFMPVAGEVYLHSESNCEYLVTQVNEGMIELLPVSIFTINPNEDTIVNSLSDFRKISNEFKLIATLNIEREQVEHFNGSLKDIASQMKKRRDGRQRQASIAETSRVMYNRAYTPQTSTSKVVASNNSTPAPTTTTVNSTAPVGKVSDIAVNPKNGKVNRRGRKNKKRNA